MIFHNAGINLGHRAIVLCVDGYGIPIRFDEKILFVKARRSKHRRFHAIYKPFITAWLT